MTPGEFAVEAALAEWQQFISARPECYPRLSEYLRAAGERRPYPATQANGRPYQWCGAFACWAWLRAGLRPDLGSSWASTYRIARLFGRYQVDRNIPTPSVVVLPDGREQPLRAYHTEHGGARVCLAGREPVAGVQVGDVALVGRGASGAHVTLVIDVTADGIATVSGNGWGAWPGADRKISGVVTADVPWSSVAWVIRPAPADLDRTLILRRAR